MRALRFLRNRGRSSCPRGYHSACRRLRRRLRRLRGAAAPRHRQSVEMPDHLAARQWHRQDRCPARYREGNRGLQRPLLLRRRDVRSRDGDGAFAVAADPLDVALHARGSLSACQSRGSPAPPTRQPGPGHRRLRRQWKGGGAARPLFRHDGDRHPKSDGRPSSRGGGARRGNGRTHPAP